MIFPTAIYGYGFKTFSVFKNFTGSDTLTSDHNVVGLNGSPWAKAYNDGTATADRTLSQWQGLGFDFGSASTTNLALDGNYLPLSTSPCLVHGTNIGPALDYTGTLFPVRRTVGAFEGQIPQTFAQWTAAYGISGLESDTPQSDGVTNLQKYFADIDPTRAMNASDLAALPVTSVTTTTDPAGDAKQYLTLSYRENTGPGDLTVGVAVSDDLASWATVTPDFTQTVGTDPATGDPIVQVQVDVTGASRKFGRLILSDGN